ncbi:nucleotidyltransferase domain-containing protein [uncultured Alsobacter sp.]|uniref:nucleotidyltransferase domain-containing protein n=1 Tax=uncultured Alsobacter sp. TaxID=1748258 RepID=UPI0025D32666|nr:nucleotidyltransferase domain-containing protein [uncultured Alsobacter sp.]
MSALPQGIVETLARVPGIAAVVLGGSRARGRATEGSDWDLGLVFHEERPFDPGRLATALEPIVDAGSSVPTGIGAWGPWIVGGAWLKVGGTAVDLLYRPAARLRAVIAACRDGAVSVDYQPGHPHGFVSAIWMGEIALCRPLHDPTGLVAELKALADPYPEALASALVGRFGWEATFSAQNARKAAVRGDATHVAGCAYRTLACVAQVLFALNRRHLINEKGALAEAAALPLTLADLGGREAAVWQAVGDGALAEAVAMLEEMASALGDLCSRHADDVTPSTESTS